MEEIGRRLRAAREAKGLSLETVEEDTHIRRKYVEALETGHYGELPGDAYAKGFLRTYGNYLGLDGTALVEQYKQGRPQSADESQTAASAERSGAARQVNARPVSAAIATPSRQAAAPPAEGVASRPAVPATVSRPHSPASAQAANRPAHRPRPTRSGPSNGTIAMRRLVFSLVVLALIGALGYFAYQVFNGLAKPVETPPVQEPPPVSTVQPEPTAPPPALPEPPKVTFARGTGEDVLFTVPGQEISLTIEPNGQRVWMQVTVDGKLVFDGFPSKNMDFKGGQIKARMGHMNEISVVVNGQRFDKPLKNGPYTLLFNKQ